MPARTTTSVSGFKVRIEHPELDKTSDDFKAIARQIGIDAREQVAAAAEETVLPRAKTLAPQHAKVAPTLVVRKGPRGTAYMTTSLRGKKGRFIGLLEYGGTVKKPIVPKGKRKGRGGHARAVMVAPGVYRAKVNTPRKFKAHRFMSRARDEKLTVFGENLAARLHKTFGPYR